MRYDNTDLLQCLPQQNTNVFETISNISDHILYALPPEVDLSRVRELLGVIADLCQDGIAQSAAVFDF